MSERWFQERKREAFYRKAKKEGYRARSAYKLQQMNGEFRLFKAGDVVIDLGAAPGGWSQAAVEIVGPTGRVIGVDLDSVDPMEGAVFVRGDMTRPETVAQVRALLVAEGRELPVKAVISDMSPSLSGHYDKDQAESAWLCSHALDFAEKVLAPGGNFVCKIFEGSDYPEFLAGLKNRFGYVKPKRPQATRKSSSEVYLIAKGYKGQGIGTPIDGGEPNGSAF